MSIKSTHLITRRTALEIMLSKLRDVDNDSLADMLEDFPESHFRNYQIVSWSEIKKNDDEEYPIPSIKSIDQF